MRTLLASAIFTTFLSSSAFAAEAPVCGDVNNSHTINATDALLVLRKGVDQPVVLDCSAYDDARCSLDTTGCFAERFDASGSTIVDHETGLEWEKKDSANGTEDYSNPHDVDNLYQWSEGDLGADGGPANGAAFTDFLARLNGVSTGTCYLGHCDWRLPTVAELETINLGPTCNQTPCVVDPALLPAQTFKYWSSETYSADATIARDSRFDNGNTNVAYKIESLAVRAVRGELRP